MLPDNWHTLWTGDNGVSIQKSKVRLRGEMYEVRTTQGSRRAWNWGEARTIVLQSAPECATPPDREPEMPRDEATAARPIMYRPAL